MAKKILKSILGELLGLDVDNNLVIGGNQVIDSGLWGESEAAPVTYVSSSSFKVPGDKTDVYLENRMLRLIQTTDDYGYCSATATYNAGYTSVLVADATVDSGLSDVIIGQPPGWAPPSSGGGGGAGSDTTAIHDNVAAEISAITEKETSVLNDIVIIEDSADSNNKKRLKIQNFPVATASSQGMSTAVQITKLDGIETLADVTDATNVSAAGALMESVATTKGDIFVSTASGVVVRLGVGTNGQVITAASGETEGLGWADASGGLPSIIAESGGSRTLALTDAGDVLRVTASGDYTIPPNSSVAFVIGTPIEIYKTTTALNVGIVGGTGVTVEGTLGDVDFDLSGLGTVRLLKVAADVWKYDGPVKAA